MRSHMEKRKSNGQNLILSRTVFYQENLDQKMFEVPSNLGFYDSMNDNLLIMFNEDMTTLIRMYFVIMHVSLLCLLVILPLE